MQTQYKRHFTEQEDSDNNDIKEFEAKQAKKSIRWLKDNRANNYDARVEFAKNIFQLALSSDRDARKFIRKLSQFASFWEMDHEISTEEWQKLNNSEEE
jgi:hypothetical protein